MKFCYFPRCGKTSKTVFKAPNDVELRKLWINFLKIYKSEFLDSADFSLCEIHFNFEDIVLGSARTMLKKGSVPKLAGVRNLQRSLIHVFHVILYFILFYLEIS